MSRARGYADSALRAADMPHASDRKPASDRDRLAARLREQVPEPELTRAAAEGRLPALAVEQALGGTGRHTLSHVARASGLDTGFLRELMQALGRPNPQPRERVFTDEDVEVARVFKTFRDAGLPRAELLEVSRVVSVGMARTADAVRVVVGNAMLSPGDSLHSVGLRYARAADQLGPRFATVLDAEFRAHLREGIRGQLITEGERHEGRIADTREVAVAFADLVDYTRLGERLAAEDVGRIAGRLADLAIAAVHRPAQLVKTIGDAAMFVSTSVPEMLDTIATLRERIDAEGSAFPTVRVGIAFGPATTRGGDWFGATVNLASRVADVARPGQVLATEAVRVNAPDREWRRKRRRSLKGVDGRVRLHALERKPEAPAEQVVEA